MTGIGPIPEHLRGYEWYAPHQAWLRDQGHPHHEPGDAVAVRADLRYAVLVECDLSRAILTDAILTRADLSSCVLTDAVLTDAVLREATLPSPADPKSMTDAVEAVKQWLTEERWVQGTWIETPDGWHSGTCTACLHGAVIYVAGQYGPAISQRLFDSGYTIDWNDTVGRPYADVIAALDAIAD